MNRPTDERLYTFLGGDLAPDELLDPDLWVVCPSCDEIVSRGEANEHVCPIEGLEDE